MCSFWPGINPIANQEFNELDETKDLYFTNPQGYQVLAAATVSIPTKSSYRAHAIGDLHTLINEPETEGSAKSPKFSLLSRSFSKKNSPSSVLSESPWFYRLASILTCSTSNHRIRSKSLALLEPMKAFTVNKSVAAWRGR